MEHNGEDFEWYDEVEFNPEQLPVIKRGDEGDEVEEIQRLLRRAGHRIDVDGVYGGDTAKIVRIFQTNARLVADGRVGEKTLQALKQAPRDPKMLSQKDIEWAAGELGVGIAEILAVNEVESRGSGFFEEDKAAILYERHVMRRRLKAHNVNPAPYEVSHPNLVNRSPGGYQGGLAEYDRLSQARGIHNAAASESTSWGSFQIMGYHWRVLGYPSIERYVELMQRSEGEHLKAFVRFIQVSPRLLKALRDRDWATFARWYNGPAYAKHNYDGRLAAAFNDHHEVYGDLQVSGFV